MCSSDLHTHMSLADLSTGRNLFADVSNEYGLSPLAHHFTAGVLKHARSMSAIAFSGLILPKRG